MPKYHPIKPVHTLEFEVRVVLIVALLLDLRLEIHLSSALSLRTSFLLRYERVVVGVVGVVADSSLVNRENVTLFPCLCHAMPIILA